MNKSTFSHQKRTPPLFHAPHRMNENMRQGPILRRFISPYRDQLPPLPSENPIYASTINTARGVCLRQGRQGQRVKEQTNVLAKIPTITTTPMIPIDHQNLHSSVASHHERAVGRMNLLRPQFLLNPPKSPKSPKSPNPKSSQVNPTNRHATMH